MPSRIRNSVYSAGLLLVFLPGLLGTRCAPVDPVDAGSTNVSGAASVSDPNASGLGILYPSRGCEDLVGDANGDGRVDGADYTILADNFGAEDPAGVGEGDFNLDRAVNGADYTLWADNFGATRRCCDSEARIGGCFQTGHCPEGTVCVAYPEGSCVPSHCACDENTGGIFCTNDCGGGSCEPVVPVCCDGGLEPGTNGLALCETGATCCIDGAWRCNDDQGNSICAPNDCVDYCIGVELPPTSCESPLDCSEAESCVSSEIAGCHPSSCECDPDTGVIHCTKECGPGCFPNELACCNPATEPGTNDNPYCFEGHDCCGDGFWRCRTGSGESTCERQARTCERCCDPELEPGANGDPVCIEGASCCANGEWSCNDASGESTCAVAGCVDRCAGFEQPGCLNTERCREGFTCEVYPEGGCVSSHCVCDSATGSIICTDDCGGGSCVAPPPQTCCDPAQEPGANGNPFCFEGHDCCGNGRWSCREGMGETTCERPGEACVDRCALPADAGPCEAAILRWWHDSQTGYCEEFIYGGCLGNENNFTSKAECEGTCVPKCEQSLDVGPCDAAIPRWWHNPETSTCEPFAWGGCEPNGNNFAAEVECEEECLGATPADDGLL